MEFRQDCLFHRQLWILTIVLLLIWGSVILWGGFLAEMPGFSLFLLALLLVLLIRCSLPGDRICADADGIRCSRRNDILWSYTWQEIRVLRCGRYNRYPVITVVPFDPPQQDLQSPQSPPLLCFQANRPMKQQIRALCKCPFED